MNDVVPQAGDPVVPAAPRACRNCDAQLSGRYCSVCGQVADVHVPSTMEIIHEVLEGLTHSDSRLWNTLRCLLFRPGRLTQEFIAGRRVAYLPPFRLYLILSVLYFFFVTFTHPQFVMVQVQGDTPKTISPKDAPCDEVNGPLAMGYPQLNARLVRACKAWAKDDGVTLNHLMVSALPKVFFVILPIVALLHMLLYRRPRHRYAEHLLLFLHNHAFFFAAGIVGLAAILISHAWPVVKPGADLFRFLLILLAIAYTAIAMRQVFGGSWTRTIVKTAALLFGYLVVMAIAMAAVSLYVFLQL